MTNIHNKNISWIERDKDIIITLPHNFNFSAILGYLQRNSNECMFSVENEAISTVISVGQTHSLVKLSVLNDEKMIVTFLNGRKPTDGSICTEIVNYVIEWFDLKYDLTNFYEMAKDDDILQAAAEKFSGLRLCGVPNLFEALSWGIIGQQINLPFAYKLKRQFVEEFGASIKYNGNDYWIFPTYERIANLEISDFDCLKMTERKKEYLLGVARLMADQQLTKEKLLNAGNIKTAEKMLTNIRGIGPWTANYVLMRCLRYEEAFPMADVGLQNAIKFMKNSDEKPSKELLQQLNEKWNPHQAYATFYLWRLLY